MVRISLIKEIKPDFSQRAARLFTLDNAFAHIEPVTSLGLISTLISRQKVGRHKGSGYEFCAVAQKRGSNSTSYCGF